MSVIYEKMVQDFQLIARNNLTTVKKENKSVYDTCVTVRSLNSDTWFYCLV